MRGRLSLGLNRGALRMGYREDYQKLSALARETLVAFLSSPQRSCRAERRARSSSAGVCVVSDTELAWIVCVMATRMKTHIFQNSTLTRRPRSA